MGTAIKQLKHPVPGRVKPSFVIFDSQSECPDVKNYKWRFNPVWHRMLYSCTHMATVGVKGLSRFRFTITCSNEVVNRPRWLVPIVSSNPSVVYCRLTSLKFSASPALLMITFSFLPVAWNSSTNLCTDSSDDRSSYKTHYNHLCMTADWVTDCYYVSSSLFLIILMLLFRDHPNQSVGLFDSDEIATAIKCICTKWFSCWRLCLSVNLLFSCCTLCTISIIITIVDTDCCTMNVQLNSSSILFCTPVVEIAGRSNLCSVVRGNIFVPWTRTEFRRRSFHVAAPAIWNALPAHLRSTSIFRGQFRAGLKTYLFNQAFIQSYIILFYKRHDRTQAN